MREYTCGREKNLVSVRCNRCGRQVTVRNGIAVEGLFSIDYPWGYFSEKDGEIHSIDLCENCYDAWIQTFAVAVDVEESKEMI